MNKKKGRGKFLVKKYIVFRHNITLHYRILMLSFIMTHLATPCFLTSQDRKVVDPDANSFNKQNEGISSSLVMVYSLKAHVNFSPPLIFKAFD